jgi:hypothetical protein
MFTGGERVLQPQTTTKGRPTPSISQLKVQNSDHWPKKANKYGVMCFTKNKPG